MRNFLFLLILVVVAISCNTEDDTQIGDGFVSTSTKAYFIDSLTVKSSTMIFDSVIVSTPGRLLIGSYDDSVFGQTYSKSYIRLTNNTSSIDDDAVFDSIVMVLKYDNYFYNDTIPEQRFNIYRVLDDIEPNDDDNKYYNVTNFDYDPSPIANINFLPRPGKNDSLEIKMNNSFGLALFNDIRDEDLNDDAEEFLDEYKGFLVDSDPTVSTSVLGFSTSSYLRIYYSVDEGDDEPEEYTLDFSFDTTNTFNQAGSDKAGTYFEGLDDQETLLPSSETDNNSFIQAGTGIATHLDFPYLKNIYDISSEGDVLSADLKFSLKRNSSSDNLSTRDSIMAFIVNDKSEVLSTLSYSDGTSYYTTTSSDNSEFSSDQYSLDLTSFVNLKLGETHEEYFLIIYPQGFNNSVDRYIFNNEINSDDLKMKLELTYASYE